MNKLFYALMAGFALACVIAAFSPAQAEEERNKNAYTLEVHGFSRNFVVLSDPRNGHCMIRWQAPSDRRGARQFDLNLIPDHLVGDSFVYFRITSMTEDLYSEGTRQPDTAALAFDHGNTFKAREQSLGKSLRSYVFIPEYEDMPKLLGQFAAGNKLHVKVAGIYTGSFPLRGSHRALNMVQACNKEMSGVIR